MAFIQTAVLIFTIFAFYIGQIARLNLFGIQFPLIDIAIIALSLVNFIHHLVTKNLKNHNQFFTYFLVFTWILLGFTTFRYHINSLKPIFYLVRLTCILSLIIFPPQVNQKIKQLFYLSLLANIVFGLIQYLFWPDFTYFDVHQWDPHLYRLISTYFDPTFTGLIYLFFIIAVFLNKNIPYRWFILALSYLAMIFTYSRSTYLSFLLAFTFISLKLKNIKIFFFSLLIIIFSIFLLPRRPGEGTKLERTSSITAKIDNYKEGVNLFAQSPLIGFGYNHIPFIRQNRNPISHANSGFDGSLLTLLVTTGLIGTTLFILGIKQTYLDSSLLKQTFIWTVLFHSLFANSLLYPWILLSLVLF
jgi:hypothetical protein